MPRKHTDSIVKRGEIESTQKLCTVYSQFTTTGQALSVGKDSECSGHGALPMEPTVNAVYEYSHSPSPICSSAQGSCSFQLHLSNVSMHKLQKRQLLLLIGQTQVSSKPLADGMSFSLASWCPHMRVIRAPHMPSLTSQMLEMWATHSPGAQGLSSLVDPKLTGEPPWLVFPLPQVGS